MKKLLISLLIGAGTLAYSQYNVAAQSPRQTITQQFSISQITLDYGRPLVKGRKVFGELVPFGKVWRAGANSASKITFAQAINFGGKVVPAGTYGLFVIPEAAQWKVILNKDAAQWGAMAYDEKLNVAESTVPVQKLADKQEAFELTLSPKDENSIDLILKWDYTKVSVPLAVGKPETVSKIVQKLSEIRQIEKEAAK